MVAPHQSKIGWTDYSGGDANFVTGCTPISEGCRNCYARAIYERFGKDFSQVDCHPDKLERLAKWTPRESGLHPWKGRFPIKRPMTFVCDTGDLFHEDVPFQFIAEALDVMAAREDVIWQVLTKRPARMLQAQRRGGWRRGGWRRAGWPENVWVGATVENQVTADERIPLLLEVPAAVRFVSVEPMLEPVVLTPWIFDIDWVICGAESGPERRGFDTQWAVHLYYQCGEANVPFFYKQGSAVRPGLNAVLPGFGVVQEWPQ
jgi:protein gp37